MSGVVTTTEARLIRSVRAVLRGGSVGELKTLVTPSLKAPPKRVRRSSKTKRKVSPPFEQIGPTAMRLLCDSIRTGTVAALVRRGGWRPRHGPNDAESGPSDRRLWEVAPDLPLTYSPHSYQMCRWLCGVPLEFEPTTLGDDLLFRFAADAVRRCNIGIDALAGSPLVWLAHPMAFSPRRELPDWSRLMTPEAGTVLHGLRDDHAGRWARFEVQKAENPDPVAHAEWSRRQLRVLESFLDAVEAAERFELASFLVDAGVELAKRPASAWVAGLPSRASLSARSEASSQAAALLRCFARLSRWYDQLATVPFFEEEYHRAQRLVAQWEHLGRDGFAALSRTADQLESGRLLTPEPSP